MFRQNFSRRTSDGSQYTNAAHFRKNLNLKININWSLNSLSLLISRLCFQNIFLEISLLTDSMVMIMLETEFIIRGKKTVVFVSSITVNEFNRPYLSSQIFFKSNQKKLRQNQKHKFHYLFAFSQFIANGKSFHFFIISNWKSFEEHSNNVSFREMKNSD